MNIALSLEGTLLAQKEELNSEPIGPLAAALLPAALRPGAKGLLRELAREGHRITLYSRNAHAPLLLWLWGRLSGLPVHRVVRVPGLQSLFPPLHGQDLVVDDSSEVLARAWQQGVLGVCASRHESDWTAPVRETVLACALEALGYPFTSSLQNHGMRDPDSWATPAQRGSAVGEKGQSHPEVPRVGGAAPNK